MPRPFTKSDASGIVLAFALVLLLAPIVFAAAGRNDEDMNRRICATNLRGISQSFNLYGADNGDIYPFIPATSATTYDVTLKPEAGTKEQDAISTTASIYKDKKLPNNPMVDLWLLVLRGQVAPKQFLCPSDPFANVPAKASVEKGGPYYINFQDPKNVSYSMPFPWALDKDKKVVSSVVWRSQQDASLPIICDMAPYLATNAKPGETATQPANVTTPDPFFDVPWAVENANSQNHQFQGQNVGYGDAHVEFQRIPGVGQNNNSLWAIRKDPADEPTDSSEIPIDAGKLPHPPAGVVGNFDTVMIPTRDAKGNLK